MTSAERSTALVVTGGGARAAYEVGVLKALRELTPEHLGSPFSIYCGISAGSINAAGLAIAGHQFHEGVEKLLNLWSNIHVGQVYRVDPAGLAASSGRWLRTLLLGWLLGPNSQALLDTRPLLKLLTEHLDFSGIDDRIASRALRGLSITCSGYTSGQCVSFFQGRADLEPWHLPQRAGAHVTLSPQHIMASMAVPFLFPPVRLHREYFGDGAMRELTPLSPAVRLGADRMLVIGTGRMADQTSERWRTFAQPTLAETAGHVLAGIYVDRVTADIERVSQINRLVARLGSEAKDQGGQHWRPIELMTIQPKERPDQLASGFLNELPGVLRTLLRGLGVRGNAGGSLLSYILFEAAYTKRLIDLGYRDAMAQRGELTVFLDLDRR